MSLETPRSSAGLTTPRTFDEIIADDDDFRELLSDSDKAVEDDEELWSCSSSTSNLLDTDDTKLNVISRLVNTCFDCNECENETRDKLSLLEIKFTEELMARHRQMQLMIEYEEKIRDWFSEKNAIIENLKQEKAKAESEQVSLIAQLETVSRHLLSLENSFNDVHKKYERAKNTIQILNRNVTTLKSSLNEYEECVKQKELQFNQLREHAEEQLNLANVQLDLTEKTFSSERSSLLETLRSSEAKVQQLTVQLSQKDRENAELLRICDFLLQTFEKPKNYASDNLVQSSVSKWLSETRNNRADLDKCMQQILEC